ncbi:hypothetical protein SAMN05216255_3635 [Pseudomonas segetis]|uniref:Uncharacterized protein n=1 Tax=Pseudomonas segetis TaxID=298908 RepID=A0A239HX35_9PSED|nr:hypothetical protein SAMN05216255_3635 [Pseudomonas segetis]
MQNIRNKMMKYQPRHDSLKKPWKPPPDRTALQVDPIKTALYPVRLECLDSLRRVISNGPCRTCNT